MRRYRDPSSPWGHGVFYEDHEFESVMDEMRGRAGKGVFERGKGIDVDLVLKRVYDLDPDFVPLPEGTLGRTTFHPDGRLVLEVSETNYGCGWCYEPAMFGWPATCEPCEVSPYCEDYAVDEEDDDDDTEILGMPIDLDPTTAVWLEYLRTADAFLFS